MSEQAEGIATRRLMDGSTYAVATADEGEQGEPTVIEDLVPLPFGFSAKPADRADGAPVSKDGMLAWKNPVAASAALEGLTAADIQADRRLQPAWDVRVRQRLLVDKLTAKQAELNRDPRISGVGRVEQFEETPLSLLDGAEKDLARVKSSYEEVKAELAALEHREPDIPPASEIEAATDLAYAQRIAAELSTVPPKERHARAKQIAEQSPRAKLAMLRADPFLMNMSPTTHQILRLEATPALTDADHWKMTRLRETAEVLAAASRTAEQIKTALRRAVRQSTLEARGLARSLPKTVAEKAAYIEQHGRAAWEQLLAEQYR